ncbi:MAG: biopolymer transporter ExbD [Leptospirales bacterium]|nr:biopolymer transporter ExbD [Leptospirales bacterium]
MIQRKRRRAEGIPLSAMGDIAFLLMIFYMATTLVTDQKPREVDSPRLDDAANMSSPYPLVIYVDREMAQQGKAYFFNQATPLDDLPAMVQERAALAPAAVRVYLTIERGLPYQHMNAVIQALREAGVKNLVITTRPEEGR